MTVDLVLSNLSKSYGAALAVDDVSLEVRKGEWLSLLGPSGCGKTTTLRMIAGFIEPSMGLIEIKGRNVTQIPPYRRNTGMVFQNFALFPHMTVDENIAYGLRIRKEQPAVIRRKVEEALSLVRLEGYGGRYPTRELSGGQQQRVALARALVIEPDILLLDEPLSSLDAKLREELCVEMSELQRRLGITTIYVTHDQEEALSMSTRIAVMSQGRLIQIGTPAEIYERPATRFVADFIGKINIVKARLLDAVTAAIVAEGGVTSLTLGSQTEVSVGTEIELGIRPELIEIVRGEEQGLIYGTVRHVAFYGGEIRYRVAINSETTLEVSEHTRRQIPLQEGDRAGLKVDGANCLVLK